MKNPLTLAGIEPATFKFVAQHLNHCSTAVPIIASSWLFIQVGINSFPDYRHLLQENYCMWNTNMFFF